jgi:hypothetical protein
LSPAPIRVSTRRRSSAPFRENCSSSAMSGRSSRPTALIPGIMARARRWGRSQGAEGCAPRGARALSVRRSQGDGLWGSAARARFYCLLGRDRQTGACRRWRRARGATRTDRGRGRAPLACQSLDVSLDRRGCRGMAGSRCRDICSTFIPACSRASVRTS